MAGINPATGKFDPYYNSGAGIPAGNVTSKTNKAGVTTFTNVPAAAPAPGPTPETPQAQAAVGPSAEDLYWAQRQEYEAAQRRAQEDAVIATVQGMFAQYGLSSLYDKVVEFARKGYNGDAIAVMLRSTPEYKQRFPAMEVLAKKGRAISEAAYVDYERTAAQIEQRYGLAPGMVTGNVTKLLTDEVSAAELNDRVVLASADSLNAPEDLKTTLRDYYNLDPQMALSSYYLDPDVAMPLLEKQSATARIGVWIGRQGVRGVGKDMAEELQAQGVTEAQAEQGFGAVKTQEGFTAGKGETIGAGDLTRSAFGNAGQASRAERIAQTRANKFQGGGGFADSAKGVGALGSSG